MRTTLEVRSRTERLSRLQSVLFTLCVLTCLGPRCVVRFLGRGLCFLRPVPCALFLDVEILKSMKWRRPESSLLGQLASALTLVKRRRIITKADVTELMMSDGSCIGCIHEKGRCNLQGVCSCALRHEDFGSILHTLLAMYRSVSLLVPINNGVLSDDTIEMGEAIGTRPLISSKSRCIRNQTTQMQYQGLRSSGAPGAGGFVYDVHENIFSMNWEGERVSLATFSGFVCKMKHPSEAEDEKVLANSCFLLQLCFTSICRTLQVKTCRAVF